ncbi:MAG: serine/threonine protein kinase, partial [Actinobacteria bacterium]|nr:serine/threonine protein kinase [Actinomycetota bacterium]
LIHPNIVQVYDTGVDEGRHYIVMEYVEGRSGAQILSRQGPVEAEIAAEIGIEACAGLDYAHRRGIIHRDVKPGNLMISGGPVGGGEMTVKLTDFGISRQLERDGLTATGRVLGTTDYVSPEQAMGHGVDQRSDLYSLGVLLYEMLTGQVPYHADSQVGVAMKHVNEEMPDVQQRRPELSAAAALVVERATAKDPNQRYQDIGEMIDDLSTALEVEAARAGSTTGEATSVLQAVPPAKRKLSSRARWSWAAIALIALVGGGALVATQLIGSGNSPVGGGGGSEVNDKGTPVEIIEATAYDPEGDGHENNETVGYAIDGNPTTTAWSTEHYDSPDFAGTKTGPDPGVGLYVTTEPAKPTTMVIRSPTPGWNAQIFATAGTPPEGIEEWGSPIAEVKDAKKVEEITLSVKKPAQHFLIWFTKASPARDQEGRYQVEISNVKLVE